MNGQQTDGSYCFSSRCLPGVRRAFVISSATGWADRGEPFELALLSRFPLAAA
jgi:hypothetical protein